MKWRRVRTGQVEDRRGMGGGFGGGGIPIGMGGGIGGAGILVILAIVLLQSCLGGGGGFGDVGAPLQPFPTVETPAGTPNAPDPDSELRDFVEFVVADVQDSWARTFAEGERQYEPTTLVLFTQATQTGCGVGNAATGPFYCPLDRKVYLDLGFFRELRDRFGAPGDFAQAYVIAHEFGHHIQTITRISEDVRRAQQENPDEANELSVRLELQADCLAGIWGHTAFQRELLEEGDLEEGLQAAAAIGDDRIQRETRGRIDPETWTHGSSEQRVTWFRKGFDSGDPGDCNTFKGDV